LDTKKIRKQSLDELTNQVGVYALCDLDRMPIYIGQSLDGIKARVQRHLTSARSDVIANRQLDIWEICEVWAWPVGEKISSTASAVKKKRQKDEVAELEHYLIHLHNNQSPLVNGKLPPQVGKTPQVPEKSITPVMSDEERELRLDPIRRLPRQLDQLSVLFKHILEVKDNSEQRRMLKVHFDRTSAYYAKFMSGNEDNRS